jgi:hypothetical protein
LYSLRSVKNILPSNTLRTLYFSLFHCHLIYALEIWSSASKNYLQPLITKQKAAVRILANKKYNEHTEPLFKSLSILTLPDLISVTNLKFFHSIVHNYAPIIFANTWATNRQTRDIDDMELRNDNDYYVPRHRTDVIGRMPLFNLPRTWNEMPVELTSTRSRMAFNEQLNKFYIDKLNPTPNCNRLLCPSCIVANITVNNN